MASIANNPLIPSHIRASQDNAKPVTTTYASAGLTDSNHSDQNRSFKYDPLNFPLKSTQQLNIDWSKFENHTFFCPAEVKVNEAFNNIINSYPFDGSKKDVEIFFDKLTGFEKYVYDQFPTWAGSLLFSGTAIGENPSNGYPANLGTYISIKDKSGNLYPELAKNNEGSTVLNPDENTSLTIEMQLFVPQQSNGTQIILQKNLTEKDGFSLHLEPSVSTAYTTASFSVSSGSYRMNASGSIKKGVYNHICVTLNKERTKSEDFIQFYVNEKLESNSSTSVRLTKLSIDHADLLIGSGSSFYSNDVLVTPTQTLSGVMDELRVFHSVRDTSKQVLYSTKGLYSTPDLKLYFRFNEPPPMLSLSGISDPVNAIVLDSSGNSLHSTILNFTGSLRINSSADPLNPLKNEKAEFKKVLFPAHSGVLSLNSQFLTTAKNYDRANPNMILKIIPQHYLLEGALEENYERIEGNTSNQYGGSGIPGQGEMGSNQIIATFLCIWAKFFDDIKLFIDNMAYMKRVDYDLTDTVPDNFLEDIIKSYGLYLPPFFAHSETAPYVNGDDVDASNLSSDVALKKIQAQIMRRVIISLRNTIRSKGTMHSIKSFLRSVGIDPDNSLKIREYGGATTKSISAARDKKMEPNAMASFITSSNISSPFLTASRIEPGHPFPEGNFLLDSSGNIVGTTSQNDKLLTSGSWTVESIFKFTSDKVNNLSYTEVSGTQSLLRMMTTGSLANSGIALNVIATQKTKQDPAYIKAYLRPGMGASSPGIVLPIALPDKGIFDGDMWHVSFSCQRNDSIGAGDHLSSSYSLRVAKSDHGDISHLLQSSSFFKETNGEGNCFREFSTACNASGSYISIGRETISTGSGYRYLNDTNQFPYESRITTFTGRASNVRFWSKYIDEDEWKEHVRNYKSTGVSNPYVNYNYVTNVSGSFQRLRLDAITRQEQRNASSLGEIDLIDYSVNNLFMKGKYFDPGSEVLVADIFSYSYPSPEFDEAATDDKVRIRSFESLKLLDENPFSYPVPSYFSKFFYTQEEPQDVLRLSIEFSLIDALDRDMTSMFSSLDILGDALGKPELAFSSNYPDLERLRDIYFNRISEKLNFKKFLEFYRWFDISLSSFIEQIIPSKTRYKGTNFVIESHMLERHKNEYRYSENYMGDKQVVNDSLLLQQIVGIMKKY